MVATMDEIRDAETIYRRVPDHEQYFADSERSRPSLLAFRPNPAKDGDGLSLTRHGFGMALERVADRGPGKSTYLASLLVGTIRGIGLALTMDPLPTNPGHCILPGLNANTPKHRAKELQLRLVTITRELLGPFRSPGELA